MVWAGGALVVVLFAATGISSWLWGRMLQPECVEVPRADLSLQEMVDVKVKVDDSERAGSSELVFDGAEASFVLREVMRQPLYVETDGPRLRLVGAFPYRDQCYNLDYDGGVVIENGVAELDPERFRVGDLDLTAWVQRPIALADVGWVSADAAALLVHLEWLRVDGGTVRVKVDDVRALR